jgi:hypothetical protein
MLWFNQAAGVYECHISQRVCLDTLKTGLCTNPYNIYSLDIKPEDGVVSAAEMIDGSTFCADRPVNNQTSGDGICDVVTDLGCPDTCTKYTLNGVTGQLDCTTSGSNNLCDEWDKAAWFSCKDDPLSPNSRICDSIDSNLCGVNYNPVCVVNATGGFGHTYPNSCFAKAQGQSTYVAGTCTPDIVQCYATSDCKDLPLCYGGSTMGISKACLGNRCEYTGVCADMACTQNSDCVVGANICIGVTGTCSGNVCVISGSCLQPPASGGAAFNLWTMIQTVWTTFWNWVKSLV